MKLSRAEKCQDEQVKSLQTRRTDAPCDDAVHRAALVPQRDPNLIHALRPGAKSAEAVVGERTTGQCGLQSRARLRAVWQPRKRKQDSLLDRLRHHIRKQLEHNTPDGFGLDGKVEKDARVDHG